MLSWLVNKMPKSAEEAGADLQGANVALFTEIVKQLGAWWVRGSGVALTRAPLKSNLK
jgi:hypothetical protein